MKVAYIDTSFLLGVILKESSWQELQQKLFKYSSLYSHHLLEAEAKSCTARENLSPLLLNPLLLSINLLYPDSSLTLEVDKVFDCGYVRGADSLHLAMALQLAKSERKKLTFLTLDKRQEEVARALGFVVLGLFN